LLSLLDFALCRYTKCVSDLLLPLPLGKAQGEVAWQITAIMLLRKAWVRTVHVDCYMIQNQKQRSEIRIKVLINCMPMLQNSCIEGAANAPLSAEGITFVISESFLTGPTPDTPMSNICINTTHLKMVVTHHAINLAFTVIILSSYTINKLVGQNHAQGTYHNGSCSRSCI